MEAEPDAKHPRYIFKNLQYDSMHRLDLFTLPCKEGKLLAFTNPWTVQTFIVGRALQAQPRLLLRGLRRHLPQEGRLLRPARPAAIARAALRPPAHAARAQHLQGQQ